MVDPVYSLSVDAIKESFEDGALILNLKKLSYIEVNPTASYVLDLSDGKRSARQVAQILADEYEIDSEQALQDVIELYQDLSAKRIIKMVKPVAKKGR